MIDQTQAASPVDLSKYIEVRFFQDRPHIRGKRIPVAMIVQRMRANAWTVVETAYDFTLSESEVVAAILYYEEHQAEIERLETAEAEQFQAIKQRHGDS